MSHLTSLKARITERPFGTLTKRELELTLLDFLIAESTLPSDPAGLAKSIRCTLTKAHAYLTDLALRNDPLDDETAIKLLINLLNQAEVSKDGMFIELSVQEASLRLWLEQSLAAHGLLQGQTLRRDLIKLSAKAIVTLVFTENVTRSPKESLPRLRAMFGNTEWFKEFEKSAKRGIPWERLLGNISSVATILQLLADVSK